MSAGYYKLHCATKGCGNYIIVRGREVWDRETGLWECLDCQADAFDAQLDDMAAREVARGQEEAAGIREAARCTREAAEALERAVDAIMAAGLDVRNREGGA